MNPVVVTMDSGGGSTLRRWSELPPELPLLCGMCGRRLCDISGNPVRLLRVSKTGGIPRRQPPAGARGRLSGARQGEVPRHPKVYVSEAGDRWRIWHEHKGGGRGPLDRTVTSATLEKLYAAALAADEREVVLR